MKIWDRENRNYIEEREFEKGKLEFLYHTLTGRILLKGIVCRRFFSKMAARTQRSRKSVRRIKPFVEEYHIDMSEWEGKAFTSFDDFFTRQREYYTDTTEQELMAADARLSVYYIDEKLALTIKNSVYTLSELTGDNFSLEEYRNGTCLVYRLAVEDYHRYVYCDDGRVGMSRDIPGVLHTVRPVSERYRVFSRNHRIATVLHTKHFSDVIQIEVGALLVGKIHNHTAETFSRLQEKGYFSYGGSTIIQLFKEHAITIDEDILDVNAKGTEVKVHIGERIGEGNGAQRDA